MRAAGAEIIDTQHAWLLMPGTYSGRHGEDSRCWCGAKGQGPRPGEAAKGRRLRQSRAKQEVNPYPAPTSTPTNRPLPRDSVCLALSSTIPSFPPSPPVPPVVLQNATKSATSLKSPQQAKFAGAHSISEGVRELMYTCASKCLEFSCLGQGVPCQPLQDSVVEIEHGLA